MMRLTLTCTRYAEPDWLIRDTLHSLSRQEGIEADILFLDQQEVPALRAHCQSLGSEHLRFHYMVIPAHGLSYARNRAIDASPNDIILFIDSDAVADGDWARSLGATLEPAGVGVAGGRIVPRWLGRPPWLARSRMVQESYSMLDLGRGQFAVDRLVGASFGLHRGRLGPEAHFDEALGRRPGAFLGGEETDLCRRARSLGLEVFYNGEALVEHQVLPERLTLAWILRRFYHAGYERALTSGHLRPSARGRSVMDYVAYAVTLPASLLGYWRGRRG